MGGMGGGMGMMGKGMGGGMGMAFGDMKAAPEKANVVNNFAFQMEAASDIKSDQFNLLKSSEISDGVYDLAETELSLQTGPALIAKFGDAETLKEGIIAGRIDHDYNQEGASRR